MLAVGVVAGGSPAAAGEIEFTGIDVGFDGAYRTAVWTPVEVTLRTQAVPFSGEVGITEDGFTEFHAAVALPANATGRVRIPAILTGPLSRLRARVYVPSLQAPVLDTELGVSATDVPCGTLLFLADSDVPESRLAEFGAALAKDVGGDATAQVRICRVHIGEFPARLEFYEPFDGVILSEGAQAAAGSDRKLNETLRKYGETMGLVLLLTSGQLPAKIPPRREMLSFPYTYRISGETGALFEPRPWAPNTVETLTVTAGVATLLLAMVSLLFVRGPSRATEPSLQHSSASGRFFRRVAPFFPCIVALAGVAAISCWRIGEVSSSSYQVCFRFSRLQGLVSESDEFFLIDRHNKDSSMLRVMGDVWLSPCLQRNAARELVVSFDAQERQRFSMPETIPGDTVLLAAKRIEQHGITDDQKSSEVFHVASEPEEGELLAAAIMMVESDEGATDLAAEAFTTDGKSAWRVKDALARYGRVPGGERRALTGPDARTALPRVSLSNLVEELYAGDRLHRTRARQLDFWRRAPQQRAEPALFWFEQSKPGDRWCCTAPFEVAPDDAACHAMSIIRW